MISRNILQKIEKELFTGKVILILGPRQVGKSTLTEILLEKSTISHTVFSGDDADVRELFKNMNELKLKRLFGDSKLVVIDEAQRIENIGVTLKIGVDKLKDVQVIATGSSAFELAEEINEPLTGRKWEHLLLPFSFEEMVNQHGLLTEKRLLNERLVFGYYPEIVNHPGNEKKILSMLSDSYLYKDVLSHNKLKKPDVLQSLLKALALQVGNEVSYNELAKTIGADKETIERYIDLLEKTFVVYRLTAFSRNVRNELKKSRKVYFYDNGIRNAIIGNFTPIELRNDVGALWENFVITERLKYLQKNDFYGFRHFWRTTQQQEIDYLEEQDGILKAFEFKWNAIKKHKIPKTFTDAYPTTETYIITPENMDEFLMD
jgi:predicted AAA+ superfamily ATPase